MKHIPYVYFGLLLVMSIITLSVFAYDKHNSSRDGKGRIPEIVLLSLCSFGGSLGALIGMYILRHKTNPVTKFHFFFTVWLSVAVQAFLSVLMVAQILL